MPRLLPSRSSRDGKIGVGERTDSDTDMVGPQIGLAIDSSAAFRTEMEPQLPASLTVTNVDPAASLDPDIGLSEEGADAEGRAGPSLTFSAVARVDKDRFAHGFHSQRTAAAMSDPKHRLPLRD